MNELLGLGLLVHCLLALFSFGFVLLVLLVGPPLGGCQFLVMLLVWLLLMLVQEAIADEGASREVHWVVGSGSGGKRTRLN